MRRARDAPPLVLLEPVTSALEDLVLKAETRDLGVGGGLFPTAAGRGGLVPPPKGCMPITGSSAAGMTRDRFFASPRTPTALGVMPAEGGNAPEPVAPGTCGCTPDELRPPLPESLAEAINDSLASRSAAVSASPIEGEPRGADVARIVEISSPPKMSESRLILSRSARSADVSATPLALT